MALILAPLGWAVALALFAPFSMVSVSEGRQIKPGSVDRFTDTAAPQQKHVPFMAPDEGKGFGQSDVTWENNFRPTTPGNSPGAGHSLKGFMQEALVLRGPGRKTGKDNHPVTASPVNDFRPTGLGHSPGVGHTVRIVSSEPKA